MKNLNDKIIFPCGISMKNRFMLAPLTNTQSHEDGCLSDEEFNWLTLRAKGNFGLTMSCASHVQEIGKGFSGQLGIFNNNHIEGLKRLTDEIKSYNSLAVAQLHHAGMRSPENIIKDIPLPIPLCVICSPSHIRKIVPATNVTTVVNLYNAPGSRTTLPEFSSPTATP